MTNTTDVTGRIVVVVGNPQPRSRTSAAATLVGERLAALVAADVDIVELADHGPGLLAWGDPGIDELRRKVLASSALVVATPTYKATYTGLTKLFLDRFDSGELAGKTTVALMTGGSPAHSLALPVHLTPVLSEIGASCPAPGLYLSGPQVDHPGPPVDEWFSTAEPVLRRALGAV